MIGKEAQEYLEKNKNIIDKVILVDVEEGTPLKCLYYKDIDEVLKAYSWKDSSFKDDNNEWYSYDNEAYCLLVGVTFNHHEEFELEVWEKDWVKMLKDIIFENISKEELFKIMKEKRITL